MNTHRPPGPGDPGRLASLTAAQLKHAEADRKLNKLKESLKLADIAQQHNAASQNTLGKKNDEPEKDKSVKEIAAELGNNGPEISAGPAMEQPAPEHDAKTEWALSLVEKAQEHEAAEQAKQLEHSHELEHEHQGPGQ
jgi:hypothetical protein